VAVAESAVQADMRSAGRERRAKYASNVNGFKSRLEKKNTEDGPVYGLDVCWALRPYSTSEASGVDL